MGSKLYVRDLFPGIGEAVAKRTVYREKADGNQETWGDVAARVARGNTSLHPSGAKDYERMRALIASGTMLMAGRHLAQGDENQPQRPIEPFTNCSTAATAFQLFLLMLSGSGVGTLYDSEMMLVDWTLAPKVICVLDRNHPDYVESLTPADLFVSEGARKSAILGYHMHRVEDSREGWAKAVELLETMTYAGVNNNATLVFDFSDVRPKGAPIAGMANKPASGPVPFMEALEKINELRSSGFAPWKAAMYAHHALAECVVVGGARRAARIACMRWDDPNVLGFIDVKRENPGLWSSNNSLLLTKEFWADAETPGTWANTVFEAAAKAGYFDGTGEPGFLNIDRMSINTDGLWDDRKKSDFESPNYTLSDAGWMLMSGLLEASKALRFPFIVNPCGEIVLFVCGGYCTLAEVALVHGNGDDEIEEAFRLSVRSLVRVNSQMPALYNGEVRRTNRIGIGFTSVFEYAWMRFGYTFHDLINETKSMPFWTTLRRFALAVRDEADSYSDELGVVRPHTTTCLKPSGSVSKLFGLTEAAHLPSFSRYLRYVQFRNDDPKIAEYQAQGYPVRELQTYKDTTIVGFPTALAITNLGIPENELVHAGDVTPDDTYRWIQLLEKYWLLDGEDDRGNQISITLKYNPANVTYEQFRSMLLRNQSRVRACSVMPHGDMSEVAYEYMPENPLTKEEFDDLNSRITRATEEIDLHSLQCASGACPI